ncbi:MAG: NTP pyrophosphohydrolase [Kineosporiaceae bacterium]
MVTTSAEWIVDVANVVGSRPDGWWRDRPGATRRLLRRVADAGIGSVIAVVEGAASTVADLPGVDVVRAAGSGDDEIVSQAARRPGAVVVTADRGLRGRLPQGTPVMGPRDFLDRLGPDPTE